MGEIYKEKGSGEIYTERGSGGYICIRREAMGEIYKERGSERGGSRKDCGVEGTRILIEIEQSD